MFSLFWAPDEGVVVLFPQFDVSNKFLGLVFLIRFSYTHVATVPIYFDKFIACHLFHF